MSHEVGVNYMMKTEELLGFVYQNNEYYKKKVSEHNKVATKESKPFTSITDYPLLTRQELQTSWLDMLSKNKDGRGFDNLLRKTSSGSSGIPINVYWDPLDYNKSMLPLWRLRSKHYGIFPSSRKVNFIYDHYQSNYTIKGLEYILDHNTLSFCRSSFLTKEDYDKFYMLLVEFNPEWMYIQPSVLNSIVDYLKENNRTAPLGLRYIECAGELLTDDIRKKTQSFFNVPIASMYGSEEMNGIAFECPYHTMHIIEDNVFAECLTENGISQHGKGEIVLTNLHNHTMPLIRYLQGDYVNLETNCKCKCGQSGSYLKTINGRSQEAFIADGYRIDTHALVEAMTILNNVMGDVVKSYKFIYSRQTNKLITYMSIADRFIKWKSAIIDELKKIYQKHNITGIDTEFIFDEKIDTMAGNKFKILVIQ